MNLVRVLTMIIGIGVVLMVGVIIIQNINQLIIADPNLQNDQNLKFFQDLFSFRFNTGTIQEPTVLPTQEKPPSSPSVQEPKTINNSTYLNSTEFNQDYMRWKNG